MAKKQKAARTDLASVTRPFVAATDFVGKPFGPDGPDVHFRAGIPSTPVPVAYIESLSPKKAADKG
jgi:hypothetical protein